MVLVKGTRKRKDLMEDRKSQKREDNGKSAQHQLEGAVFHFNVSQGMDSIRGSIEVTIRCFRCATSLVAFCLCSLAKMMMTTSVQALLALYKTCLLYTSRCV